MKKEQTFRYCENCNKAWEITSPPSDEAYENGLIDLEKGELGHATMLLPKKSRQIKKGYSTSCAVWFDGIYCNAECLYEYLKKILAKKKHAIELSLKKDYEK